MNEARLYLFIRTWEATSVKVLTPSSFVQERNKWAPNKDKHQKSITHLMSDLIEFSKPLQKSC